MMTAQVEPYSVAIEDLQPHYGAHWAEVALDRDKPEAALAPQWGAYEARDRAGELVLITLRELGALVGYFICFVAPDLHYAGCLTARMDILYVAPTVRGRHGGMRLIRAMRHELTRRGVRRWFVGEKIGRSSGLGRMFEIAGFRPVETYYSAWLGD